MLTDTTTRRLETLGTLSKEGKRINGLFRLMETPHLWWQAYANIHGNRGAATPGSDGSSLDGFSVGRLLRIIATLKSGTYRFNPVRRVYIPKSNGKTRPLGIPSGDDKLVHEVTRMLLEKIYEPVFSDDSHGFRNGRSCHTALMQVKQKWTGMKWIVNMDIKGYFDNIDHDVMVNILARRIDDPRFLALIRSMLKAGYVEDWRFHDTYSGTPQGGVVSPILANIYLHELDEFVTSMRARFEHGSRRAENREYKNLCETIKRRMKQVDALKLSGDQPALEAKMREIAALDQQRKQLRSSDPMDANYRRLVYIRYADDFLLGVIGTHADAVSIMQQVARYIGDELRLEIAEDKSGVVHASEGVRFLGYDVRTYTGIVDEGHEYKNEGSAQGQAFGVLARKCSKTLLLTGTLMGGYADDLFYLLWRLNPRAMMADGFGYSRRGSLGPASMGFLRAHGVIKDIYKSKSDDESRSHRTARGRQTVHRAAKGPGFGPNGIMRYVVPISAFLKLKQIGGNVLPPYEEHFDGVRMTPDQLDWYRKLEGALKEALKQALRAGDHSLLGVVLNALLAWPDCAFRAEHVVHPHHRSRVLAHVPVLFGETEPMPKELKLIERVKTEKAKGRKVLVYTVYTGTRDTTARLKTLLASEGFKVATLSASVAAEKREDWVADQVDRGIDVLITNPELVKTGLDLLEFPTIVFLQSGYNVYVRPEVA